MTISNLEEHTSLSREPIEKNTADFSEFRRSEFSSEGISTRTYAAKEAVRQAREKVKRNDLIVSQLMEKSYLDGFESTPTKDIILQGPGELIRPGINYDGQINIDDTKLNKEEESKEHESSDELPYRIETGSNFLRFFRDMFD